MSLFKKIIFSVIFFLVIFICIFCVGEILFRVIKGPPNYLHDITQQQSKYLFEPGKDVHSQSSVEGEFDYTAHINQFGYRGADFKQPKPEDVIRFFVVGDSYTFGVGSEDNQTIPSLLDQKLKEINSHFEVINAGIGHTSPVTHYVNIRDIHLQYEPDFVLLLLDLTDVRDDWYSLKQAVMDKQGEIERFDPLYRYGKVDWWFWANQHSQFCRWINRKIVRTFQKMQHLGLIRYIQSSFNGDRAKAVIINSKDGISKETLIEYDGLIMMRGEERKKEIDYFFQQTGDYLIKIRDLLVEHHIPLVLGMYPHGIYVGPNQWNEGRKTWGFKQDYQYKDYYVFEMVEKFAIKNNIPFVNTLEDFLNAPADQYFFNWDGHMTPAANRILVQSVMRHPVFLQKINEVLQNSSLNSDNNIE